MQTYFNGRSPGGQDSSSSSFSAHPYRGSRGSRYQKRGLSIRGRGASYQRGSGSWYSRNTVKDEPLGDALAQSLLSRLEPSSDSLLNRLSPGKETLGGLEDIEMSSSSELRVGRTEREAENRESDSVASSRNNSPQRPAKHQLTADELIASALAQGKQQLSEQHASNDRRSKSPASEAAVDDLLATDDREENRPPASVPDISPATATSAHAAPIPIPASSMSENVDRASLVEQARKLFIPVIIQNARLRNPEMDPEELEKKVVSLVTDEQCLAFVKLAQEARDQAQGKEGAGDKSGESTLASFATLFGGGSAVASSRTEVAARDNGGRSESKPADGKVEAIAKESGTPPPSLDSLGMKRQRESTAEGGELPRPAKVLRRTTFDGNTPAAYPESRSTALRAASLDGSRPASPLTKEPPKAPKAMRGLPHSMSEPSSSLASWPSPEKMQQDGHEGRNFIKTDLSPGTQTHEGTTSHTPSTAAKLLETPSSNAVVGVVLMSRIPSASSDMDIDDDSSSPPGNTSPAVCDSEAPPSSLRPPITDASLAGKNCLSPAKTEEVTSQHRFSTPVTGQYEDASTTPRPPSAVSADTHVPGIPPMAPLRQPPLGQSSIPYDGRVGSRGSQTSPACEETQVSLQTDMSPVSDPTQMAKHHSLQSINPEENGVAPVTSMRNLDISTPNTAADINREREVQSEVPVNVSTEGQSLGDNSRVLEEESNRGEASVALPSVDVQKPSLSQKSSKHHANPDARLEMSGKPSMDPAHATSAPLIDRSPMDATPLTAGPSISFSSQASRVTAEGSSPTPATATSETSLIDVQMTDDERLPTASTGTSSQESPSMKVDSSSPLEISSAIVAQKEAPATSTPPLSLPCLCFVEVGKPAPQVSTLTFSVDPNTAAAAGRWSARAKKFDPSASHVMFRLLCLRTIDVEKVAAELPTASPEEFASAMWRLQTTWPRRGQLLLEVNGETESQGNWLPKHLGPEDGPIDLTPHIVPGENTLRVIQLAALTDRLFIVYAGVPPEEEHK